MECVLARVVLLAALTSTVHATHNAQAQEAPLGTEPRAGVSQAERAPLSLADALVLARQHSPIIAGNAARIDAAQAKLRGAGVNPNPVLILAQPFGSSATGGFDEGVVASQTIEIGKRGPRTRAAASALKAVQSDNTGRGTTLDFDVSSAYYTATRARVELDLAQNALEVAQKFDQAAHTQLQAGDAPRQNTVRSSIEVARAGQNLRAAQAEYRNRVATLKSLTGIPTSAALELGNSLTFTPQQFEASALQTMALQNRAELLSARADLQARQAAIRAAQAARLPDGFVEARRAAIVPQQGQANGNSVRIGISLPLFDLGSTKASVKEARAGEREGELLLAEAQRVATLEVDIALATFQNAQSAVQSFDNGRLAKSSELLEMAQIGYDQGASTYLELLDAQTVFRNEQVDYARALANWNIALADLKRAVGGNLPVTADPVANAPTPSIPTTKETP